MGSGPCLCFFLEPGDQQDFFLVSFFCGSGLLNGDMSCNRLTLCLCDLNINACSVFHAWRIVGPW